MNIIDRFGHDLEHLDQRYATRHQRCGSTGEASHIELHKKWADRPCLHFEGIDNLTAPWSTCIPSCRKNQQAYHQYNYPPVLDREVRYRQQECCYKGQFRARDTFINTLYLR